ncbi:MAG: signal peptidase I [Clostridiales bacterium]|jgi:signal peptidase I|nr:signal peptidase I [Clostridiales bacterium]
MLKNRITNPILRSAAEWLVTIGLAVLLFFAVRGLIRTAKVDGSSMAPTLEHGDMVVLNRIAYFVSSPRVGDIVAFPYAQNPSEYFIKRVIALPGDMVDFHSGYFYVNGVQLEDEFSAEPTISMGNIQFPIIVEDGHFFVLGDNRIGSQDSRFSQVGTIPEKEMVGRASLRIWPLDRLGRVE